MRRAYVNFYPGGGNAEQYIHVVPFCVAGGCCKIARVVAVKLLAMILISMLFLAAGSSQKQPSSGVKPPSASVVASSPTLWQLGDVLQHRACHAFICTAKELLTSATRSRRSSGWRPWRWTNSWFDGSSRASSSTASGSTQPTFSSCSTCASRTISYSFTQLVDHACAPWCRYSHPSRVHILEEAELHVLAG